jgi:hypothetical protein
VRARRALFSTRRFGTHVGAYDVLRGGDGFLMLEKRGDAAGEPRLVFVERWQDLLRGGRGGER